MQTSQNGYFTVAGMAFLGGVLIFLAWRQKRSEMIEKIPLTSVEFKVLSGSLLLLLSAKILFIFAMR